MWLYVGVFVAVYVVILICRLLATAIRDINTWDRRNGYYDED
jgi:hypothetical protein